MRQNGDKGQQISQTDGRLAIKKADKNFRINLGSGFLWLKWKNTIVVVIISLLRANTKITHAVICTVCGDINQGGDGHIDPVHQNQCPFLLGLFQ